MDCSNKLSNYHFIGFKESNESADEQRGCGIKRSFSQIDGIFKVGPIELFGHDVKLVILNEFDVSSLMAFSLSTKFYREIAKDTLVKWINLKEVAFEGLIKKDKLQCIINFFGKKCSEITSFTFNPQKEFLGDNEIELISKHFIGLKILNIKSQLSKASMASLKKMTSLDVLKLARHGENDINFSSAGNFSNLNTLYLKGYEIKNLNFLCKFQNLEHLLLQMKDSMKEASFGKLCPSLKSLDIRNYHGDDLDLEGCSAIDTLKIDCLNIENINFIKNTPLLKKLSISLNGDPLDLNPLQGFTALQELSISNAGLITIDVLKGCTQLEQLEFSEVEEILGIDVLKTCGSCLKILRFANTKFATLPLQFCPKVTEVDLWGSDVEDFGSLEMPSSIETLILPAVLQNLNFVKKLSALKSIDLSSCDSISDIQPLSFCRKLEEVNIAGLYSKITDIGALQYCETLKKITLSAGYNGEDIMNMLLVKTYLGDDIEIEWGDAREEENVYLTVNSPREGRGLLEVLTVPHYIKNLNFLEDHRSLKALDLSFCDKLENIEPLRFCQLLEVLDISGANLTFKDISVLMHCKNLKKIIIPTGTEEENVWNTTLIQTYLVNPMIVFGTARKKGVCFTIEMPFEV